MAAHIGKFITPWSATMIGPCSARISATAIASIGASTQAAAITMNKSRGINEVGIYSSLIDALRNILVATDRAHGG